MEISEELFYNLVQDLKKREITREQKGEIVSLYMKKYRVSQRKFAIKFGIPHSTVQDWVSGRQMRNYYAVRKWRDNNNFGFGTDSGDKNINDGSIIHASVFRKKTRGVLNEVDFLVDRLIYVLYKDNVKPQKSIKRLEELQRLIDNLIKEVNI